MDKTIAGNNLLVTGGGYMLRADAGDPALQAAIYPGSREEPPMLILIVVLPLLPVHVMMRPRREM